MKRFSAGRLKWKRHRQEASDEPLLDTPEKRSNLLKQIAAGIAMNKPPPR
jgi:hypothetical protein